MNNDLQNNNGVPVFPNNNICIQNNGNNQSNNTFNPQYNNSKSQYYQTNYINQGYFNKSNVSSLPPNVKKFKWSRIIIPFLIVIIVLVGTYAGYTIYREFTKKNRTFMIYMVGSDLESKSKSATYDLQDVIGENIDLKNNNVVLMVGGSKEWHNFVSEDEIAIYELKNDGFEKKKTYKVSNMGSHKNLSDFLNYVYDNYSSDKYDMIFWNHGVGAAGLELDELTSDFIDLNELDYAFESSPFNKKKLELTIFVDCLVGNLQIAKVMDDYSDYMVASEEVIYVGMLFDRLKFLEKVEASDTAIEVANKFIICQDESVNYYNTLTSKKLDSTYSLIDLSKIENLSNKLNKFVATIDLNKYYYSIATMRGRLHTYGSSQASDYDTVDMRELIDALKVYTTSINSYNEVSNALIDTVLTNSSLNPYSNGLSIYFPYLGSSKAVSLHFSIFDKQGKDDYVSFIEDFSDIRTTGMTNNRATFNGARMLTNYGDFNSKNVSIELTSKEQENYISSNILIFKKDDNNTYDLLYKTDKVINENNRLYFDYNGELLKDDITLFDLKDNYYVYGVLDNDTNVIANLVKDNNSYKIANYMYKGDEGPVSSIIDTDEYEKVSFKKLNYELFNDNKLDEEWEDSLVENLIKRSIDDDLIFENTSGEYYAMFEYFDIYNDVFYSKLIRINK